MKALVFDTETTGLVSNRLLPLDRLPHVIELTAIVVDIATGETFEELNTLIQPPIAVPDEITKITGITDEMVKSAQPFAAYAAKLQKMLSDVPLAIAHNAAFDRDMVEIEFDRLSQSVTWPRVLCTVEASLGFYGYRLTLGKLYEYLFSLPMPAGAHRARNDVEALIACCKEMYSRGMV